jgi:hypothetical protein
MWSFLIKNVPTHSAPMPPLQCQYLKLATHVFLSMDFLCSMSTFLLMTSSLSPKSHFYVVSTIPYSIPLTMFSDLFSQMIHLIVENQYPWKSCARVTAVGTPSNSSLGEWLILSTWPPMSHRIGLNSSLKSLLAFLSRRNKQASKMASGPWWAVFYVYSSPWFSTHV